MPFRLKAKLDLQGGESGPIMALGGKLYPIDSFPFSHADWEAHFGARWSDFEDAKEAFDPDHVLTPGQGIF